MYWQMRWWCIRKDEGRRMNDDEIKEQRAKDVLCFSRFLLLPSFFSSLFPSSPIHPSPHLRSVLILFSSPFLLGVQAPSQVRDLAEELPNWANRHCSIIFSSFLHLRATGYSHLALPRGESLFGGDSQAQMFVGSDYSSLPSSSRVNRISILMLRIPVRSPKGCTVGRCFGFDPRRDD